MTNLFLPILILLLGILFLFRGKRSTDAFLRGAKNGLSAAVSLFPTLLLFLTAVSLFRASGAAELITVWLSPLCQVLHIPSELLPLLFTRPISGSASTAVLSDLFSQYGADSRVGFAASILAGSSETMLYVLALYCTGKGERSRRMRHVFPAAFLTTLFVTALSLAAANWFYQSV